MKESMSIVAAPATILFIVLLALLTINSSFCSGRSDLGSFKREKQDSLRFNQELKDPSNRLDTSDSDLPRRTLKAAYGQPKTVGQIPPLLGNLGGVESLDLSSNKLGGRIPWQLTNLTFLSALNLSHNQLVGLIPQGNQFNTFSSDSYEGNLGLCGPPLTECSDPSYPPHIEDDTDSKKDFGWKVVLMGYGCGTAFGLIIGCLVFTTRKPQWLVNAVEGNSHKTVRRIKNKQRRRRN
ncbi:putative receptor like protein 25 isoform X5 [Pistacia vera]|uniref:putative receptor like protein 25 isoform X5 n=1 Tax=Pistacia vera TaxID=55513 RepID=UPI0012634A11|nr:putative receptor like protein 25 isoform X5 [Pistacia vera]